MSKVLSKRQTKTNKKKKKKTKKKKKKKKNKKKNNNKKKKKKKSNNTQTNKQTNKKKNRVREMCRKESSLKTAWGTRPLGVRCTMSARMTFFFSTGISHEPFIFPTLYCDKVVKLGGLPPILTYFTTL